jgi:methionine-rich copper-binding protein CopC
MKEKVAKSTQIDAYTKPTTKQAVSGHAKIVHVNPAEEKNSKDKAAGVKDAISQEIAVSPGITFLQEGETAAKEYTLADGRRVGMDAETLALSKKAKEAGIRFGEERTPEALEEKRAAEKAYKIAFAGSVRNFSLADLHMRAELTYMMRPRTKDEQELKDLMQEARRIGEETGREILKPIPPHEEFMREMIKEKVKTPEDAARHLLGGRPTEDDVQKLIEKQTPGWLQKRITKREIKRVRAAIARATS